MRRDKAPFLSGCESRPAAGENETVVDSRTAPAVGGRDHRHARRRLPIDTQARRATPRRRRPASPGCGVAVRLWTEPDTAPAAANRGSGAPTFGGDRPLASSPSSRARSAPAAPAALAGVPWQPHRPPPKSRPPPVDAGAPGNGRPGSSSGQTN